MYENIPETLKKDNKWVCARDRRKMPLRADMLLTASLAPVGLVNYEDVCASVDNPETWGTFESAYDNVKNKLCSHIGYVFDGNGVIGVDLDHCFDDGVLNDKSLEVINKFKSYTEISKSGEGIHILVRGRLPFTGSNNRDGVEIYSTRRFFILTGRTIVYKEVVENQEAINWLLEKHFNSENVTSDKVMRPYHDALYKNNIRLVDSKLRISAPEIKQGSRNCTLLSYGGVLKAKGYSVDKIIEKVHEMNSLRCVPPLSNAELDNIIRSITKYAKEV